MALTDQAIKLLVERGFPMLPSTGASKGPCVRWKEYQNKLPTADQSREWGRKYKPARWGLVTGALSGVVVVDFDGEVGTALMRKWGIDPHVRTGSGGYHWYVKHPGRRVPTLNAKNSARTWPWQGLDIRGDGGFAVLLGRNSNGDYVQLRELVLDDFDALPEEVRSFLRNDGIKAADAPTAVKTAEKLPRKPSDGNRPDVERLVKDALQMAPRAETTLASGWRARFATTATANRKPSRRCATTKSEQNLRMRKGGAKRTPLARRWRACDRFTNVAHANPGIGPNVLRTKTRPLPRHLANLAGPTLPRHRNGSEALLLMRMFLRV